MFLIFYLISVLTTLGTIFWSFVITSDIPLNYTTDQIHTYFKFLLVTLFLWLITILLSKTVKHYIANIIFCGWMLYFFVPGFLHNKKHYIYYNEDLQWMDLSISLVLLLVLLVSLFYCVFKFLNKKSDEE